MTLGDDVYEQNGEAPIILMKVYLLYDKYAGEDKVFPIKNGAPRIMTKYQDIPYSYELQPEYAAGNKKYPCVKAMDWTGKTATAQVIRGLCKEYACSGTVRSAIMHLTISHCSKIRSGANEGRPRSWFQGMR